VFTLFLRVCRFLSTTDLYLNKEKLQLQKKRQRKEEDELRRWRNVILWRDHSNMNPTWYLVPLHYLGS
jgi:hypothetical protein